jgi:hypothetical protein
VKPRNETPAWNGLRECRECRAVGQSAKAMSASKFWNISVSESPGSERMACREGMCSIEPHNAHEIDRFAAGLGDAPRGVDAATRRIKQQGRHHGGIKRRLAPFAAIGAGDFPETEIVSDQAQHKAGEMVLGHEVRPRWPVHRAIIARATAGGRRRRCECWVDPQSRSSERPCDELASSH